MNLFSGTPPTLGKGHGNGLGLAKEKRNELSMTIGGGYKPDSVPSRAALIHLGQPSLPGSRSLPGNRLSERDRGQATLDSPIWPCSAWGLPCPRRHRRGGALLPHPFTLTSTPNGGSLLSAALSLALPRPGVTRHAACQESGLSSDRGDGQRAPAASDRQLHHTRNTATVTIHPELEAGAVAVAEKPCDLGTRPGPGTLGPATPEPTDDGSLCGPSPELGCCGFFSWPVLGMV